MNDHADILNPWLGLRAYEEHERHLFFGRAEATQELLRVARRGRLTVLFGVSGIGKSSLLRAGLFPKLREENFLPIVLRPDYADPDLAPARQVIAEVEGELRKRGIEAVPLGEPFSRPADETLWEYFHRLRFWQGMQLVTPVLVFDQFEELFTRGQRDAQSRRRAETFVTELADLIENQLPLSVRSRIGDGEAGPAWPEAAGYKVLLALREDYLAELDRLGRVVRSLTQAERYPLAAMSGAEALEAVLGPGRERVEPEVAERIVRWVAAARPTKDAEAEGSEAIVAPSEALASLEAEPFLLSLVCRELCQRAFDGGQPQISAALMEGHRTQILEHFYESCFAGLDLRTQCFVEDELVGASGYRELAALEKALGSGVPEQDLLALVDRRLIRLEEDRHGVKRLELTHDVLTRLVAERRRLRREREMAARMAAYRRRFRLALGSAIAIAILFVAAAWGVYDIFWREHADYYARIWPHRGFPMGIRPLTPEEVRTRPTSYKMIRSGRNILGRRQPYTRVELVDSGGRLMPDPNASLYLDMKQDDREVSWECAWEFVADEKGNIVYTKGLNKNGEMLWGMVYSPMTSSTMARARFVGPDGYSIFSRDCAAEYVEMTYNAQGDEIRWRYIDGTGGAAPGPDGVFESRMKYDAAGRLLEMTSIDEHGAPMFDRTGVCTWRNTRDATGLVTRIDYLDTKGRPCYGKEGYSTTSNEYDAQGRMVSVAYFDPEGKPALAGVGGGAARAFESGAASIIPGQGAASSHNNTIKSAYHRQRMTYDERGNLVQCAWFDKQDRPTRHGGHWAHMVRFEYDPRGRKTAERYFGPEGAPALSSQWYHSLKITYDAAGNVARRETFGKDGKPVCGKDGYAAETMQYDARGNRTAWSCFDEAGRPTLGKPLLVHRITNVHDRQGQPVEEAYWAPDGKPLAISQGYHRLSITRDARGHEIVRATFDRQGRPVADADGIYTTRNEYDDHGNPIKSVYCDASGKPDNGGRRPYAMETVRYDRWNRPIEYAGLDADGKPVRFNPRMGFFKETVDYDGRNVAYNMLDLNGDLLRIPYGFARICNEYDERWNQTAQRYYDETLRPARLENYLIPDQKGINGTSGWTMQYDALDREVARFFWGSDGKPVLNANGVHSIRIRYDERGYQFGWVNFGTDGKPTAHEDGSASARYAFDFAGRRIEGAYFDVQGKPALRLANTASAPGVDGATMFTGDKTASGSVDEHRFLLEYDERGLLARARHCGLPDDRSTTNPLGVLYETRFAYDARGNRTEIAHYGPDRRPARDRIGRAVQRFRYDAWGNIIEESYFDERGRPMIDPLSGVHRIVREFNPEVSQSVAMNYGIAREACFGPDGKPAECRDGHRAYTMEYGTRGPTRAVFYDAQGKAWPAMIQVIQVSPGGQLDRLGVRMGDYVLAYDGVKIESLDQLRKMIFNPAHAGNRPVVFWRKGKELTFRLEAGGTSGEYLPRIMPPELRKE